MLGAEFFGFNSPVFLPVIINAQYKDRLLLSSLVWHSPITHHSLPKPDLINGLIRTVNQVLGILDLRDI